MRYYIFVLILLLTTAGCEQEGLIIAPVTSPMSGASKVKNGILYTFAVSKDKLGIFDTLKMTLTAYNKTTTEDTLNTSEYDYSWSLTNGNGKIIASGPKVLSNVILIRQVLLKSHQSAVLYQLGYSMSAIFGAPIVPGIYILRWNLNNGLSFQLNLECGKSENEITDPSGVASPIYPLKVGNKWTFRENYLFSDTVLFSDTTTQTIVGEEMMNGEKWFLMVSTVYVDQLLTSRQDGIYVYYSDIKTAVLKYKYPATMGEEYTSGYEEWTGASDTLVAFQMTVDSTNELVSVPKGQYQCYKYHAPEVITMYGINSTLIESEDLILSNIGPVKKINGNIRSELVSTNFQ
ncbi:MAG: hypothetical protein WAV76_10220 [Bacteroidota bacterium]